ncbi:YicC/YloC family endoribonuclease [Roseateles puraquae]|uniref:YicC family protein n=1 Tax=Roseateles puraquae TaxID=431059 RepID=A0A254NHD0_9BURK|nr:YicC/YloC family endoribonuclease [Roseateles puraquae]MDG0854120.1 YicC family protein [Roseateles puraquae]OWR05587.1 YicC family protein [Roseateles puraquae]
MPVYSMTGYANSVAQPPKAEDGNPVTQASVSVELRSVNGRFLDLSMRMPEELRGLEPQLRELIAARFKRGKIELRINTQRETDGAWPQPQPDQLNRLANLEAKVRAWMPQAAPLSVHEALNWCKSGGAVPAQLDAATLEAAQACVQGLAEAREREGEKLVAILQERISRLRQLADEAEPLLPAVVQRQQQRFLERWQEALAATGAASSVPQEALQERALNEAAAFAIRIDVAEELGRLRAHLDELTRLLKKGGELGKRLDFLIQELHREANTLGSKSAALELTNISVEMKVAIEQMREQVQNIE